VAPWKNPSDAHDDGDFRTALRLRCDAADQSAAKSFKDVMPGTSADIHKTK